MRRLLHQQEVVSMSKRLRATVHAQVHRRITAGDRSELTMSMSTSADLRELQTSSNGESRRVLLHLI
jgi:hypothetical protein